MIVRRSQFIAKWKVSLAVGTLIGIIVVDLLFGDIAKTHKHRRKLNNINKIRTSKRLVFFNAKQRFANAECKMQNAELLHYSSLRSQGYLIDFAF